MLDERLLQRVQRAAGGQAFDRGDRAALVLHRQRQARQDALAVDQHRAGAAGALVAALLGAGEMQVLAQQVEQRCPDIDRKVAGLSVDDEMHMQALPDGRSAVGRLRSRRALRGT